MSLLAKHIATIECECCVMGEHTGESNHDFPEAYTDAKAQVARCQHRNASLLRAFSHHSSNPNYRTN